MAPVNLSMSKIDFGKRCLRNQTCERNRSIFFNVVTLGCVPVCKRKITVSVSWSTEKNRGRCVMTLLNYILKLFRLLPYNKASCFFKNKIKRTSRNPTSQRYSKKIKLHCNLQHLTRPSFLKYLLERFLLVPLIRLSSKD